MQKVTQAQVAAYKKLVKESLHPQTWHDAMAALPSDSIGYAMSVNPEYHGNNAVIASEATKYLAWKKN